MFIWGIVHPMALPETSSGEGSMIKTASKIPEDAFFGAIENSWTKDQATLIKLAR